MMPTDSQDVSRIGAFDVLRGFSVLSMVAFHLCYDLRFIAGSELPWFAPPLQDVWRASISWTFLLVAGCMCSLSRSNLRRGLKYLAVAGAIYLATSLVAVDTPISFGIIFCMAACTLVYAALQKMGLPPRGYVGAAILFVSFLALLDLPGAKVGIGPVTADVPGAFYSTEWFSWLGLPGPTFVSGDYYPVLPYLLMYLTGAALGSTLSEKGYPDWMRRLDVPSLSFVGRHALEVYILHQPVLLLIVELLAS